MIVGIAVFSTLGQRRLAEVDPIQLYSVLQRHPTLHSKTLLSNYIILTVAVSILIVNVTSILMRWLEIKLPKFCHAIARFVVSSGSRIYFGSCYCGSLKLDRQSTRLFSQWLAQTVPDPSTTEYHVVRFMAYGVGLLTRRQTPHISTS